MTTVAEPPARATPGDAAGAIELRGIGKRFPGVIANHDVDITIRGGTIHALVGENGAGKSTLMKILYGVQKPDDGTISVNGSEIVLATPAHAIAQGIGMVFQHFMLADNLTVLENVVLGAEKLHGIGDAARAEIVEISKRYGFELDPDELVETLGVGERQRVEILKVLYRGAKIIILDEPTAVLVPQEVDALFANLRELKAQGHTLIFISHKLDEVLAVADEITVMRRGTTVTSVKPADVTAHKLAELMVGSELPSPSTEESTVTDRVLLSVRDIELHDALGRVELADISFDIHAGEVLGIAGVEGNGQTELVETLIGMRHPVSGSVSLGDEDISGWSTRDRRESGIGYIPEDRQRHGLLLDSPLWENRILGHQTRPPSVKGSWLNVKGARRRLPAHRRAVRRTHARHRHHGAGALGGQPAEVHRRSRDERRPGPARRLAPDPRRRRRRPGADLGPHQERPARRAGGAVDQRRPRRADRSLRHHPGAAARPARGPGRPADGDTAGARLGHDGRR